MTDESEGSATVLGDRWVEFRGIEGWEEFVIRVQSRLFRGEAQATGLTVEHVDPDSRVGLTSQRLRRLPVLDLAREALLYLPRESDEETQTRPAHEVLAGLTPAEREELMSALGQGPRPTRAAVPLDRFVDAWRAAFNDPKRPSGVRETVCADLKISTRTYDRYRKQAEAAGLMPSREERRS